MGQDQIKEFLGKLLQDEEMLAQFRERWGASDVEVPAAELKEFASEHGYEFTVEETGGELSDAELEGVAGGFKISSYTFGAPTSNFEEIKVTYVPHRQIYQFPKVESYG